VSARPVAGSVRSKYQRIKTHREEFATEAICRVLGVAPSGHCEWLQRPLPNRDIGDAGLLHGYRTRCCVVDKPAVLIPNLLMRQFTVTRPKAA